MRWFDRALVEYSTVLRSIWHGGCGVVLLYLLLAVPAWADESVPAGSIEGVIDGRRIVLASLRSDYKVRINGDVATVSLRQTYENPYDQPMNATYLFPLNRRAAVYAMTMIVGDEVIAAEIQENKQARQVFNEARQAGKAAALLEQHRPNMFTQKIANLVPGLPIEVEIQYSQAVAKVDGAYELVIPMVVGPRFQPPGAGWRPAGTDSDPAERSAASWQLQMLPGYPPTAGVDLPEEILSERVSLAIELDMPLPLESVTSATHAIRSRTVSSTQQSISLARARTIDNRDFVLRYQLAGAVTNMGLLSHWRGADGVKAAGGYFSLLIEPPAAPPQQQIIPREMVFVLDCSGSMSGEPMQASKLFMKRALQQLRPVDTFRIIRFSDAATEFSSAPLPATSVNVNRGLLYTASLYGSGGTMMTSGVAQALAPPVPRGVVRNIVFLTDGYIGNEQTVLELVEKMRGAARLYAFGVGAGVNRYLLEELARVGHGFARYFDPGKDDETMTAVAQELAHKLRSPILTGLQLDWGDLPVADVLPRRLPDLYAGDSIRVTGRFTAPAKGSIELSADARGQRARLVRDIALKDTAQRPVLRRLWAKSAVTEFMHKLVTPVQLRDTGVTNEEIRRQVTSLGLNYGLATRWTSFVAVSRQRVNHNPAQNLNGNVVLPKVAGVSRKAYAPSAPAQPVMTGYAAPEPGALAGLLAVLLSLGVARRFARRSMRHGDDGA